MDTYHTSHRVWRPTALSREATWSQPGQEQTITESRERTFNVRHEPETRLNAVGFSLDGGVMRLLRPPEHLSHDLLLPRCLPQPRVVEGRVARLEVH